MLNMNIEFDENDFEKSVIEAIVNGIKEKIEDVKCPNGHTEIPTIVVNGKSLDNLELSLKCCCDEFKETIEERLK